MSVPGDVSRSGKVHVGPTAAGVVDEFGRAAKWLARRLDEELADHGMSTPRWKLLASVVRSGPSKLGDAAAAIGVSQGTASALAEGLAGEGLIDRVQHRLDRRVTLLSATPEGERRTAAWSEAYAAAAARLLAPLPRERWPDLVGLLRQLAPPERPDDGRGAAEDGERR